MSHTAAAESKIAQDKGTAPAPAKRTATKRAPAKRTGTKTAPAKTAPKVAAPSDRAIAQQVHQTLADRGAAWFASLPTRTVKGSREVQIGEHWVARDSVLLATKQCFGYTSHAITWPKAFGARDVGRPAPAKKAA